MSVDHIKAFAAEHAPALARRMTDLCGKVITKGLTGILEQCCAMQDRITALEAERDAMRRALMRVKAEAVSLADAQVIALEALKGDKP